METCDDCGTEAISDAENRYARSHRRMFGWYWCRACTAFRQDEGRPRVGARGGEE